MAIVIEHHTQGRGNATSIVINLVGIAEMHCGDRAVHLSRKDAGLLTVLSADGPITTRFAANVLWGHRSEAKALNNLRQRARRLKKAAGCEVIEYGSRLRLAPHVRITDPLADVRTAPHLARGDLLRDVNFDNAPKMAAWLMIARRYWRARRRDGLTALANEFQLARHLETTLAYATQVVHDEPLDELAHRLFIQLHLDRGDRAAAMRADQRCTMLLHTELGVTPDPQTSRRVESVRSQDLGPVLADAPLPDADNRRDA